MHATLNDVAVGGSVIDNAKPAEELQTTGSDAELLLWTSTDTPVIETGSNCDDRGTEDCVRNPDINAIN